MNNEDPKLSANSRKMQNNVICLESTVIDYSQHQNSITKPRNVFPVYYSCVIPVNKHSQMLEVFTNKQLSSSATHNWLIHSLQKNICLIAVH